MARLANRPQTVTPATERQVSFLVTLATERGWTYDATERTLTAPNGISKSVDTLSKAQASTAIDNLLKTPKVHAPKPRPRVEVQVTEDGMYRKDGVIFKVQFAANGSGRLYAKQLVVVEDAERDEDGNIVRGAEVRFDYAPGAIGKLSPADRMTVEQAREFGALYGTCIRCGATLTDEKSIEAGIGPVCAGKI